MYQRLCHVCTEVVLTAIFQRGYWQVRRVCVCHCDKGTWEVGSASKTSSMSVAAAVTTTIPPDMFFTVRSNSRS